MPLPVCQRRKQATQADPTRPTSLAHAAVSSAVAEYRAKRRLAMVRNIVAARVLVAMSVAP